MDLRQLRYFVVLAEELHFGRAAARLHIAQPALSQQIKTLEARLGLALFTRDRRHVALTAAGQAFLDEAREALLRFERALEALDSVARGHKGRLHIGYVGSAMMEPCVPALIGGFRRDYPDIELFVGEHDVEQQLALLTAGQLDIGLIRAPVPTAAELGYTDIVCQPLVAVLPETHAAAEEKTLTLAALRDETFLLLDDPPGVGLTDAVLAACRRAGFSPHGGRPVRDLATAVGLVAAGLGITLVPAALTCLALDGVVYRTLSDDEALTTLSAAYRRNSGNAVIANFIAYLERSFIPAP